MDPTDALLAELDQVAARLEAVEAERMVLYARRLDLYRQARALDPPITQKVLADHAKVSEVAVIATLRKAKEADAKGLVTQP